MSAAEHPACAAGFHDAPLVARDPVDRGESVEIDQVCPTCGLIVYTLSYGKASWQAFIEKQRKAATDGA